MTDNLVLLGIMNISKWSCSWSCWSIILSEYFWYIYIYVIYITYQLITHIRLYQNFFSFCPIEHTWTLSLNIIYFCFVYTDFAFFISRNCNVQYVLDLLKNFRKKFFQKLFDTNGDAFMPIISRNCNYTESYNFESANKEIYLTDLR